MTRTMTKTGKTKTKKKTKSKIHQEIVEGLKDLGTLSKVLLIMKNKEVEEELDKKVME